MEVGGANKGAGWWAQQGGGAPSAEGRAAPKASRGERGDGACCRGTTRWGTHRGERRTRAVHAGSSRGSRGYHVAAWPAAEAGLERPIYSSSAARQGAGGRQVDCSVSRQGGALAAVARAVVRGEAINRGVIGLQGGALLRPARSRGRCYIARCTPAALSCWQPLARARWGPRPQAQPPRAPQARRSARAPALRAWRPWVGARWLP